MSIHIPSAHIDSQILWLVMRDINSPRFRPDQKAAMVEDETSFNPDEDVRDYIAISQSLPVFCVSARAYQKLSGYLQKDLIQVDGFPTAEDTELPSLQEHTKRIAQTDRAVNCRRFLRSLDQLLNSMKLWASSDAGVKLSREEQKADDAFIRTELEGLKKVRHLYLIIGVIPHRP